MKNSGIEWIGEIPDSWEVNLVKNIFDITRGRVIAKTEIEDEPLEDYYPVYSSQTANSGILGYIPSYDFAVDSLTWTTDGAKAGTVFLRRGKYSITNVCGILTLKSKKYSLDYLNYAVGFSAYNCRRADINGYKIMSNEMAIIPIVVPYLEEQQRIAKHLDEKCGKIDELIANQQGQIEKLKEYKQSVITEAVTKGLDKSASLKDSGVEWISNIPGGWSIQKVLYQLKMPITDGPHTTPELFDSGVAFVSAEAVSCGNGGIDFNHIRGYISEEFYQECCLKYIPEIDDVYMIKSGATTGRVSIVTTLEPKFTIWSPLAVMRTNKNKMLPKFLYYAVQSTHFQRQVALGWSYGTQQNLGMRTLEQLQLLVPSLVEQHGIVEYLDDNLIKIERLIAIKQEKIEKLQEYKKSLIYEYVTGKKEVV